MQIKIRTLRKEEQKDALRLSMDTFMECGKEDYDENGLEVFRSFINNKEQIDRLTFLGAFDDDSLIGTLAFREKEGHISLFFIRPDYHRMGIGRRLFKAMTSMHEYDEMTVSASTCAVPFYESMGFKKTAEKQNQGGLASIPMKRVNKGNESR